jgi:hypothetical protein
MFTVTDSSEHMSGINGTSATVETRGLAMLCCDLVTSLRFNEEILFWRWSQVQKHATSGMNANGHFTCGRIAVKAP